jgi:hypothetical protein
MATMPQLQHQCYGEMGVFCAKDKGDALAQHHHVVTFRQTLAFGLREINYKVQRGGGQGRGVQQANMPRLDHTRDCGRATQLRLIVMQENLCLIVRH